MQQPLLSKEMIFQNVVQDKSSKTEQDLKRWLQVDVFDISPMRLHDKFLIVFSIIIGCVASVAYYGLGAEFGKLTDQWLHTHSRVFEFFFGIASYIPPAALGASYAQHKLRQLANKKYNTTKGIKRNDSLIMRYGLRLFWLLPLTFFAAFLRAYLNTAYAFTDLTLKIITASIGFLVAFNVAREVFSTLEQPILNYICCDRDPENIKTFRKNLQLRLASVTQKIIKMKPDELSNLYHSIYDPSTNFFQKLSNLIDLADPPQRASKTPTPKKIFSCLGVLLGVVAAYAFFDVGTKQATGALSLIHINNHSVELFSGIMSAIVVALFYSKSTFEGFNNIYDKLSSLSGKKNSGVVAQSVHYPKLRGIVSGFGIFEGSLSIIPAVYLTLISLQNRYSGLSFTIASTAILFSVAASHYSFAVWSIKKFFVDLFDFATNQSTLEAPDSGLQKDRLLTTCKKIISNIPTLSADSLIVIAQKTGTYPGLFTINQGEDKDGSNDTFEESPGLVN